jgi:hypothetical protein
MPMNESQAYPFREREEKSRISWGTIAAVAAVISTLGGSLIALGKMMFASKDEYTELRVHVEENDRKIESTLERFEKTTEKLTNTVERLDRNVTILNTRVGMVEEGAAQAAPRTRRQ